MYDSQIYMRDVYLLYRKIFLFLKKYQFWKLYLLKPSIIKEYVLSKENSHIIDP